MTDSGREESTSGSAYIYPANAALAGKLTRARGPFSPRRVCDARTGLGVFKDFYKLGILNIWGSLIIMHKSRKIRPCGFWLFSSEYCFYSFYICMGRI